MSGFHDDFSADRLKFDMDNIETLKFEIGSRAQLQERYGEEPNNYIVNIIGYIDGKSLIVSTPEVNGKPIYVAPGQLFRVRCTVDGSIYSFFCSTVRSTTVPYPHLYLSYPVKIDGVRIRHEHRAAVNLTAYLTNDAALEKVNELRVKIIDLSPSGALIKSNRNIGEPGDEVSLSTDLTAANVTKPLTMSGVIKNKEIIFNDKDTFYRTGIEFQNIGSVNMIVLECYIYENQIKK